MKTAKFCKANAPKIASQVTERIREWEAKGYTPKAILNHLWTYNAIGGEYKDGHYTLTIGLTIYNGWSHTFTA